MVALHEPALGADEKIGMTARAAKFAVDRTDALPLDALQIAKLSVYDWMTVALAGVSEPVSGIVRSLVASEAGTPVATVIGLDQRVPARAAALANGASSHALDYDDTHFAYVGHPTVAVFPAALAVAEQRQSSGRDLLGAYLVGVETVCRIGAYFGRGHYHAGFHQTATAGAFGATAASARLLGLSEDETRHALGLVGTRASGLKSQFGTMGKPYHAGMAASNGVEAATLASLGFESCPDGIECAFGFAATHRADGGTVADAFGDLPGHFKFVDVQYKYHACCHGTHPALEALLAVKAKHAVAPADVARVTIAINPQWLPVCCIPEPRTGLEAKFSLSLIAAMALHGVNTGALASFSEASCQDGALRSLAQRVHIMGDDTLSDTASRVSVETTAGRSHSQVFDLGKPVDIATKTRKLRAKGAALTGDARAAQLWNFVETIEQIPAGALSQALLQALASSGSTR